MQRGLSITRILEACGWKQRSQSKDFVFSSSMDLLLIFLLSHEYWWLYLMYFHNSSTIYVVKVKESIADIPTSYDVWVTSKFQVNFRFERYWCFCLINFWNVHTIHVFEVRESIADISTELYQVWVTSKIQVDFRFNTYSGVLVNVSYRFLKFLD